MGLFFSFSSCKDSLVSVEEGAMVYLPPQINRSRKFYQWSYSSHGLSIMKCVTTFTLSILRVKYCTAKRTSVGLPNEANTCARRRSLFCKA